MLYLLGMSIVFKKGKYMYLYIAVYKSRLYMYSINTQGEHMGTGRSPWLRSQPGRQFSTSFLTSKPWNSG